jgi:hypothetical protein
MESQQHQWSRTARLDNQQPNVGSQRRQPTSAARRRRCNATACDDCDEFREWKDRSEYHDKVTSFSSARPTEFPCVFKCRFPTEFGGTVPWKTRWKVLRHMALQQHKSSRTACVDDHRRPSSANVSSPPSALQRDRL